MAPLGAAPSRGLGDEIEKSAVQFARQSVTASLGALARGDRLKKNFGRRDSFGTKFMSEQPPGVGADGELRRLQQAVTTDLLPILAARVDCYFGNGTKCCLAVSAKCSHSRRELPPIRIAVAHLYDAVVRLAIPNLTGRVMHVCWSFSPSETNSHAARNCSRVLKQPRLLGLLPFEHALEYTAHPSHPAIQPKLGYGGSYTMSWNTAPVYLSKRFKPPSTAARNSSEPLPWN